MREDSRCEVRVALGMAVRVGWWLGGPGRRWGVLQEDSAAPGLAEGVGVHPGRVGARALPPRGCSRGWEPGGAAGFGRGGVRGSC